MSSSNRFDNLIGKTILRVEEQQDKCSTEDELIDLIFTDGTGLTIESCKGCCGAGAGLEFYTYINVETEGETTLYVI
ncbi:hypothetical protein [Pseudanabaena phage PA-SR01]|nr:hypothetical protein [Pseudanabaena phage PA-SR01]